MSTIIKYFVSIPLLVFILLAVNLVLAPHNPYQEKKTPFECGYHSFLGQNRTQFTISFFIYALLFLLFDLEILLVYPYAVSAYANGIYGLIIMLIFFLVLTSGFTFELGKNALNIDTRQIYSVWRKIIKIVTSTEIAGLHMHNGHLNTYFIMLMLIGVQDPQTHNSVLNINSLINCLLDQIIPFVCNNPNSSEIIIRVMSKCMGIIYNQALSDLGSFFMTETITNGIDILYSQAFSVLSSVFLTQIITNGTDILYNQAFSVLSSGFFIGLVTYVVDIGIQNLLDSIGSL